MTAKSGTSSRFHIWIFALTLLFIHHHHVASFTSTSPQRRSPLIPLNGSNRIWVPPTQNTDRRRGNVFSIQQPEDLLEFISEDDRLCVVKVYANWCRTCKAFDTKYRKLTSQLGDKYNDTKTSKGTQIINKGQAKFAEMEYSGSNAKLLVALLGTESIALPHILMYRGSGGLVRSFQCAPKNVQVLIDAVNVEAVVADDEVPGGKRIKDNQITKSGTVLNDVHDDSQPYTNRSGKSAFSENGLGATQLYLSKLNTKG